MKFNICASYIKSKNLIKLDDTVSCFTLNRQNSNVIQQQFISHDE